MKEIIALPFSPESRPAWYSPLGYLVTVVAVALATAAMHGLLPVMSVASVYLVYLVIVVVASVGWGLPHGIVGSVLCFVAANYFFTQPLFSLTVSAIQDMVALVTFLGLAILTSQLVARLRREALDAQRSAQITSTLYFLSQTLTGQPSLPGVLEIVASQLSEVLHLAGCKITLTSPAGSGELSAGAGSPLDEGEPRGHLLSVPISLGERRLGVLQMMLAPDRRSLTHEEERVVAAFAEQLQAAIVRAELQQAAVQAEVLRRTDALRVALLSAVAHDLRTPLTSIKTAATGLLSPRVEWSKEEQEGFLRAIVTEVDRINRFVSDLLDVSRIEAGRMRPHKEPHRIEEVIETVVERLRPALEGHKLTVQVEAGLPAIPIDEVQIDEVLTNLLENAAKYTPAGTPVEVRARRHGDMIRVEVADEGPGIPRVHLPHLFSRFYRVTAGTANTVPGTGLGLAIVKGIVEAHGGQVSAANAPRGGAIFAFTLPLCSRAEEDERDERDKDERGGGNSASAGAALDSRPHIANHAQEFSRR